MQHAQDGIEHRLRQQHEDRDLAVCRLCTGMPDLSDRQQDLEQTNRREDERVNLDFLREQGELLFVR